MGPAGVVELVELAITVNPIKGNAEDYEPRPEPEVESPLTGCVPGKGTYEVGQLFWISLNVRHYITNRKA
jgi:hypothetical protein